MKLISAILIVFLSMPAFAAYRVFKLKLTYYDYYGRPTGKTREVLSSLDHLQYEHYHGGYQWMRVEMLDTWYCPGDTRGYRPYCDKPKPKERAPSSLRNEPKRIQLPYNRQPVIPQ